MGEVASGGVWFSGKDEEAKNVGVFCPIDKLSEWFSEIKEPERIEVILQYWVDRFATPKTTNNCLYVESPEKIPVDKFPAIKQAIENVLNQETIEGAVVLDIGPTTCPPMSVVVNGIKYSQSDILNHERDKKFTVAEKYSDGLFKIGTKLYVEDGRFGPHKYTEKDMEDLWNELVGNGQTQQIGSQKFVFHVQKYPTFKDYLQSINK